MIYIKASLQHITSSGRLTRHFGSMARTGLLLAHIRPLGQLFSARVNASGSLRTPCLISLGRRGNSAGCFSQRSMCSPSESEGKQGGEYQQPYDVRFLFTLLMLMLSMNAAPGAAFMYFLVKNCSPLCQCKLGTIWCLRPDRS